MIAPKYINTNIINQLTIDQSFSVHYEKLKNIKLKGSGLYDYKSPETIKFPHLKNRWKSANNCNSYSVKAAEITKQNKLILTKILNITTNRALIPGQASCKVWKKSLNVEGRIKEAKRIEKDNQQLAKRLVKQKPDIVTEELKKKYKVFEEFKNRLSKVKILASRRAKTSKKILGNGEREKIIKTQWDIKELEDHDKTV